MVIEYLAATLAVTGGFMVASAAPKTRYGGFAILFAASAAWLYVGLCAGLPGLAIQSVLFLASAVWGLINNWRPNGEVKDPATRGCGVPCHREREEAWYRHYD